MDLEIWSVGFGSFLVICGGLFVYIHNQKMGISDIPNHRSLHKDITKKSAGLWIFPVFWASAWYLKIPHPEVWFFFPFCLWLLGGLDDWKQLGVKTRLIAEVVFILGFLGFQDISFLILGYPIPPALGLSILAFMGVFWINLNNFMDGMDSYLGFSSLVSMSILLYLNHSSAWTIDQFNIIIIYLFCISGFLFWNFPKAKVFLGDSGSLTIGALLFGIFVNGSGKPLSLECLFYILPVYWVDGFYTMVLRFLRGEKITDAHRFHLYQRFSALGLPSGLISSMFSLVNFLSLIVLSLFFASSPIIAFLILWGFLSLAFVVCHFYLNKRGL
jgi:UDP-N-acetylmuramyl pentapeptide phosphotransferase/UDP-N-acetylglucosamine-1-phosphate transferase